jgi:ribosomal-protein-alanine N-acetyltransferase
MLVCETARLVLRRYATEAASAAVSYLFRAFGKTRLISLIEPPNVRSQRVAIRLGMTRERDIEYEAKTQRLFAIDRSTWVRDTMG